MKTYFFEFLLELAYKYGFKSNIVPKFNFRVAS